MSSAAIRNIVLLGQCVAHNTKNSAKVRVKRMKLDKNLMMHFPDYKDYFAHDHDEKCKVGDIVLIKELQEQQIVDITHDVMKIVYPYGDITDPITGKKCVVSKYRDEIQKRNELYGPGQDGPSGFLYEDAPDRGWQEGTRDFSHKVGYKKWHEFEAGHPLHDDPVAS